MAILKVQAFSAGPAKSGVSIGQGETRDKAFFSISLTGEAQRDLFGRVLDPSSDCLAFTLTDDRKLHHLMGIRIVPADDPNGIAVNGGPHGSVRARVMAWKAASGKRPSVSMPVVNRKVEGGGVSVKLPEWARPDPDPRSAVR